MKISTVLFVLYFPVLLWVVTVFALIVPARIRPRAKVLWSLLLLLCSLKSAFFSFFGGHPFAPSLPEIFVWVLNLLNSAQIILCPLCLVWWVRWHRLTVLGALALLLAAWGQYSGAAIPSVKEVVLAYEDLPPELDGYRIVQISDLHCSSAARRWRTQAVVDKANACGADLICLTGDYVDGEFDCLRESMEPLRELKARDGVLWVTGNHEYFLEWRRWQAWYRSCGFRFLENECVFPKPSLAVGGVNDYGGVKHGAASPNVDATFAAATNGEFRVLLDHRPAFFVDHVINHHVDLQLSGHCHGGVLPLVARYVAMFNKGYVRGLYRIGKSFLYVNSGAGMWAGFPMRFIYPSEITLLTIKKLKGVCHDGAISHRD